MSKQVTVYVGRAFGFNHKDADGVVTKYRFTPGANTVPADVAEAEFVKAHQVAKPSGSVDVAELQGALAVAIKRAEAAEAERDELRKANNEGAAELRKTQNLLEAADKVAKEQKAALDAFAAMAPAAPAAAKAGK